MNAARSNCGEQLSVAAHAEVCTVRLGSARFGVPIQSILEIVGSMRPRPVPLAPEFVGGLVHYRGDVLTAVSLRRLLDLPAVEGEQAVLVIENEGTCFGLQVDAVEQVLELQADEYEPNPSTLDDRRKGLFAGAYKLPDGLLVMLEIGKLDPARLDPSRAAGRME